MTLTKHIRHIITKTKFRIPLIWIRHQNLALEDVFVASYPRSGSTWLRFLLYEVLAGREAGFDTINFTIPSVGGQSLAPRLLKTGGRLLKTHEPYRREYHKAIYIVRDVRDVVLSEFAFQTGMGVFTGGFESFLDGFLKGRVNGYGTWDKHVASWLDAMERHSVSAVFVKYEEMRRDPMATLQTIFPFLGEDIDRARIQSAVDNNSLDMMRRKEEDVRASVFKDFGAGQKFVRQGATQNWRGKLTDIQLERINQNCMLSLSRCGYVEQAGS